MKDKVLSLRASDGSIFKLEVHDTLASTANIARDYAERGYPDRYAVFAKRQLKSTLTGSKPQDGEFEEGMFLSCIFRPSIFPSQAPLIGAMSATAMITALEDHTDSPLGLGWVSDLYCNGIKIGCTTVEGKLDNFTSYEYIIVSFAVRTDKTHFPPRITDLIKQVFDSENTCIQMIMAKEIINKFVSYYIHLKSSSKFMDVYRQKFILRGKTVKYEIEDKKRSYRVRDVDRNTGELIVFGRNGTELRISSPTFVTMPKRVRLNRE